jgi:cytochrome b subunit of formate dehydrogenase/nitrate/TMAO reductase-like tetraheme cytochrome c subunit
VPKSWTLIRLLLIAACLLALTSTAVRSEGGEPPETATCLECHDTQEVNGKEIPRAELLASSIHRDLDCINCHASIEELPHGDTVAPVDCGACHDNVATLYNASFHGRKVQEGETLAPRCWDCHGSHDILPPSNPAARTTKFNIPFMCGRCHKEGTAVTRKYNIPQDSILVHYSESIHGEGLYKRGLIVTAVCSDCHTAHDIRQSTDPKSSIFKANVAATCQKCHGQIEKVHVKVVRGELWEKEPNKVPACVDCHSPHRIRPVVSQQGVADSRCLECHSRRDLTMDRNGKTISLFVDTTEVQHSIHRAVACAQCHTGASPGHERPCATVTPAVDCSICHTEQVEQYVTGVHGKLSARGDPDAPRCVDCHGVHGVKPRTDQTSPTFPINVPDLCGRCHGAGGKATSRYAQGTRNVVDEYKHGTHGIGLLSSGLVVTAMCTDCHTPHRELPADDSTSSIFPGNIAQTCARCHSGIYEQFRKSIHSPAVSRSKEKLPNCADCHRSHDIEQPRLAGFRNIIVEQCGGCHEAVTETYFETTHGKASKLGATAAAMCFDCHGSHDILPPDDPGSTLSRKKIVQTCAQCHKGAHRQFAGYLTHATHHDRTKYPILFYTFWFMTTLLVVTFIIAGTHTILWLPRSFQIMRANRKLRREQRGQLEYERFKPLHRRLHIMVVISFLGLATTGMTLKFSYLEWAQVISNLLGGPETAGFIHRICAIITFLYFGIHIVDIIREKRRRHLTWRQFLFTGSSMVFNRKDWNDFVGTLKWFVGRGPRPEYGRWTYWEKFDYFAVFWGVAIIGSTGLMLWFPEFFTRFLPGWIVNVATIVHSDEALLAVGFIFTVHFFNTHFRPDKFPMDTVIFTGRMPVEELRHDRPQEFRELMKDREIRKHLVEPLPPYVIRGLRIFGTVALLIGLTLIILIIYAVIFGYR